MQKHKTTISYWRYIVEVNGEGYITTAYITGQIKRGETVYGQSLL